MSLDDKIHAAIGDFYEKHKDKKWKIECIKLGKKLYREETNKEIKKYSYTMKPLSFSYPTHFYDWRSAYPIKIEITNDYDLEVVPNRGTYLNGYGYI